MRVHSAMALGLVLTTAISPVAWAAGESHAPARASQCFRNADYQDFKDIDDHGFYIRVNVSDIYRIDVETCPELTSPDAQLITVVRGSDYICDALDWDLKVRDSSIGSPPVACIVKAQTRLTAEEAARIPPKQRP